MQHTKTIKDERGKVEINVRFVSMGYFPDINGNFFRYDVLVWHTAKGLRKPLQDGECATPEEILAAKTELWHKIKP